MHDNLYFECKPEVDDENNQMPFWDSKVYFFKE